ncbi:MAG: tetratricopeptide repeat protein [candidate division KSB1 bacterium]|nr:tetratricopeptide repeat protein [candidate division KSB1 bacterium]
MFRQRVIYSILLMILFSLLLSVDVQAQQDPEQLFSNGVINYRNGQYQQAMQLFTDLCEQLADNPHITSGLLMAAKTAEQLQDHELTRTYARRLIQEYPGSRYLSDAYYIMGCSYAEQNSDRDALTYLAYAVENARTRKLLYLSEEAGLQLCRARVDKDIVIAVYRHHVIEPRQTHPDPCGQLRICAGGIWKKQIM